MEHRQIGFRGGNKPHLFGPAGSIRVGMAVVGETRVLVVAVVEPRACSDGARQDIGWLEPAGGVRTAAREVGGR